MNQRGFHFTAGLTAVLLLAAFAGGCQRSGGLSGADLSLDEPSPPIANEQFSGLPGLPVGELDSPVLREVSADNIIPGSEAWLRAQPGSEIFDTSLILRGSEGEGFSWAIYRWGTFADGIIPLELNIDVVPGNLNEYWLFLSDYSAGQWARQGPLETSGPSTYGYDPGVDYVSSLGNTYVALIAADGHQLRINELNVVADEDVTPPAAPRNLVSTGVEGDRVYLSWDENTEADLFVYNIYLGPSSDFQLGDAGVTRHGFAPKIFTQYTVDGLTPNETYHFRITAADVAGNESNPSNPVTETTIFDDIPGPPTGLTLEDFGSVWAELSWTAPPDGDIAGYNIYTGPSNNFDLGDPGVVKRTDTPIVGTSGIITGLELLTLYYARATTVDLGGLESVPSNTVSFTTLDNQAPVPDFTVWPQDYKQVNVDLSFDPTATTDEDNDLSELTFEWDFENDGSIDMTTIGPDIVLHSYTARGMYTTRLVVSDANESVPITKSFVVSQDYDYFLNGPAIGKGGEIIVMSANPAESTMAVLFNSTAGGSATRMLSIYGDSSWRTIPIDQRISDRIPDIAMGPNGVVGILSIDHSGSDLTWEITEYSIAGGFGVGDSLTINNQQEYGTARLAVAPSGRYSIAVAMAPPPPPADLNLYWDLRVWHEKSTGGYNSGYAIGGSGQTDGEGSWRDFNITRNDDDTYLVFTSSSGGSIHLYTVTDSSTGDQNVQTYSGTLESVYAALDISIDTNVFWAARMSNGRIYYGDNYGTANGGSQFYSPSRTPLRLLGAANVGDNEGHFYWIDREADDTDHLRGYNTTDGGGTLYEVAEGFGVANAGLGAFFNEAAVSGIFTVVDETRDGQLIGRFLSADTPIKTDEVYTPNGYDTDFASTHLPLIFADGTLLVLSKQPFPTAKGATAPSLGSDFVFEQIGNDTWLIPHSAAISAIAGEYFVGSYNNRGTFLVNKLALGNATGESTYQDSDAAVAQLAYNPASSETMLCYANDSGTDVSVRTWGGASWGAATAIYTGSNKIERIELRGRADGGWGVVFADDADSLFLAETSGGWGAASPISTEAIKPERDFIGFAYNGAGDLCVAVQRTSGDRGVWLGIKPSGGSISWEKLVSTNGSQARNIYAFYHQADPIVAYHNQEGGFSMYRMRILEKFDGTWNSATWPERININPFGATSDAAGNIVFAGMDTVGSPRRAVVGILYD